MSAIAELLVFKVWLKALKRQPSAFDHCGTIKADIYPFIFFNNCRQTSIQLDNDLQRCYLSNACHVLPKQNQWQASDTSLSRALSLDICRQMPASSSTSPICSSACWALSRSTAFLTYNKHQSILHTTVINVDKLTFSEQTNWSTLQYRLTASMCVCTGSAVGSANPCRKDLFCVWLATVRTAQSYEQVTCDACVLETEQQNADWVWIFILTVE